MIEPKYKVGDVILVKGFGVINQCQISHAKYDNKEERWVYFSDRYPVGVEEKEIIKKL